MIRIVFRYQEKRAIAYDFNTEIGECNFEETEDIWNITHTEVNEKHQGQGIAKKLVENVMENKCSFLHIYSSFSMNFLYFIEYFFQIHYICATK